MVRLGDEGLVDQALRRRSMCIIALSIATSVSALNCRNAVRVARELGAARVGDDQLGAVLRRVLHPGGRHRMVDRRIGADHAAPPRPASRRSPGSTPRPSRCLRAAPPPTRRGTGACSGRRCCCRSRCAPASGTGRPLRCCPWPSRSRPAPAGRACRGCARSLPPARSSASSQLASRNTSHHVVRVHREVAGLRHAGACGSAAWSGAADGARSRSRSGP